jgi:hypothetical protein
VRPKIFSHPPSRENETHFLWRMVVRGQNKLRTKSARYKVTRTRCMAQDTRGGWLRAPAGDRHRPPNRNPGVLSDLRAPAGDRIRHWWKQEAKSTQSGLDRRSFTFLRPDCGALRGTDSGRCVCCSSCGSQNQLLVSRPPSHAAGGRSGPCEEPAPRWACVSRNRVPGLAGTELDRRVV